MGRTWEILLTVTPGGPHLRKLNEDIGFWGCAAKWLSKLAKLINLHKYRISFAGQSKSLLSKPTKHQIEPHGKFLASDAWIFMVEGRGLVGFLVCIWQCGNMESLNWYMCVFILHVWPDMCSCGLLVDVGHWLHVIGSGLEPSVCGPASPRRQATWQSASLSVHFSGSTLLGVSLPCYL